jgi:hypothetical protein
VLRSEAAPLLRRVALRIERRNGTGFNAEACPERAACPEPVEGSESKGRRGGTEGLGDWVTG